MMCLSVLNVNVKARDVAAAFMQIMERPETDGKTFELGGPRVFTLEDFIMKLIIPETRRFDVQPAFRWNERESDDTGNSYSMFVGCGFLFKRVCL
jgi:nucleoside-diphosphate-sugar epimerase